MGGAADGEADETSKALSIVPCSPKRKKPSIQSKPLNSPINNLMDCLLIEILQKLPCAKFIIRCKSVCKLWFTLISDPYFISCFLHHHIIDDDKYWKKQKPCNLIISYSDEKYNKLFITSKNPVFSSCEFNLTYLPCFKPEERESICVLASCNDLLLCCASMMDHSVYYICNPFTMDWVTLPPTPNKYDDVSFRVGFICESYLSYKKNPKGDYTINPNYKFKVVRIPEFESENCSTLEIFSSETNKWSECEIDVSPLKVICWSLYETNIVACNGMLHWFSWNDNIVAYNPYNNTEQIRFIDSPAFNKREGKTHCGSNQSLGMCRGILRILRLTFFRISGQLVQILSVWELKDYNTSKWNLEYEVLLNEMISKYSWVQNDAKFHNKILSLRSIHPTDGDIVYLSVYNYFISCNMKKKKFKVAGKFPFESRSFCVDGYVFSIVAPWWPTPVPTISHSDFP